VETVSKLHGGVRAIVLFVEDVGRAKAFYQGVLELPIRFEDESSVVVDLGNTVVVLLQLDAARDLLTAEHVSTGGRTSPTFQLSVFVDDVDQVHTQLAEKGAQFFIDPVDRDWGKRTAHLKDPDGHIWELAQDIGR
jgi:lactoylglutathione lyase